MLSRRRIALSIIVVSLLAASALADEQVSPTVDLSISGFTAYSNGSVYYYYSNCAYPIICEGSGYIASGTHSITDGANGSVTQSTFGGSSYLSYSGQVTTGTTYEHCYVASLSAIGRYGTSQRVSTGAVCAPPAPPPPSDGGGGDDPILAECGGSDGCAEPLIIKVDQGPYDLTGLEDPVSFDINADGHDDRIGWTGRNANVAFLALDLNGNGTIDDGKEIFGNGTMMPDGTRALNGFQALAQWDANHDGVIDSHDPVWRHLLLWFDVNHDGVSQPAELQHIAESPITSIELSYHRVFRRDQHGNVFRYEGQIHKGHAVSTFYDVFFAIAK